jgi:hypothetical protein
MTKALALFTLIFACSGALAQTLTLSKINDDRTKFVSSFSGGTPMVGQHFAFKDEFDQECRLKVAKVTSTALLEVVSCPNVKALKGGEKFEMAGAAPVEPIYAKPPGTRPGIDTRGW